MVPVPVPVPAPYLHHKKQIYGSVSGSTTLPVRQVVPQAGHPVLQTEHPGLHAGSGAFVRTGYPAVHVDRTGTRLLGLTFSLFLLYVSVIGGHDMRPLAAIVLGRRFGENGGDSIVGMVEGGPEARQREAVQPPVKQSTFTQMIYLHFCTAFSYLNRLLFKFLCAMN
jgi:hypothetical protein